MALVLCTGSQKPLMENRKKILERAGHIVHPAMSVLEVEHECRHHKFDVAVIGEGVAKPEKRRILELVRRTCPTAKILELYTRDNGGTLKEADDRLLVRADQAFDLVEHVFTLAAR